VFGAFRCPAVRRALGFPVIMGPFVLTRGYRLLRFPRFLQRPLEWSGFAEREVIVKPAHSISSTRTPTMRSQE
jgi:hypothetical protein